MSNRSKNPVSLDFGIVKVVTPNALLIDFGDEEHWIPKSQLCEDSQIDHDSEVGEQGEVIIPEWLAYEKGLV